MMVCRDCVCCGDEDADSMFCKTSFCFELYKSLLVDMTIMKMTVESRFFESPREANVGLKNRGVEKFRGNITVFH